jgi:hypothetical protein
VIYTSDVFCEGRRVTNVLPGDVTVGKQGPGARYNPMRNEAAYVEHNFRKFEIGKCLKTHIMAGGYIGRGKECGPVSIMRGR